MITGPSPDLQVLTELDKISRRLQEDGLSPGASGEEKQCHLWQQLLNSEAKLHAATQEVQTLRVQQANEMKEVRLSFVVLFDQLSSWSEPMMCNETPKKTV